MNKIKLKENEKEKLEEDFGFAFNEETMAVIQANESIDILACAGSGKTTALLAKLKLLVDRMPFENNKGICVLTHTNVAIDEIKERLGEKAEILFKYPNYFGTIQSFVNEYLTIPYYKNRYKRNIISIDDDKYNYKLKNLYIKEPRYKDLRGFIYGRCIQLLNEKTDLEKINEKISYFLSIEKKIENNEFVFYKEKKKLITIKAKNYKHFRRIFIENLLYEGILSYDDAYMCAKDFLDKSVLQKELFYRKFKYVFIDEMQDTKKYQWDILSKIFPADKVIIQKFGDINQAILSGDKDNEKCGWNFDEAKCLKLLNSKRFNENIAGMTCSLRIKGKECTGKLCDFNSCTNKSKISGVDRKNKIPPHILIFDENNKQKVLEKYCKIIKINNLNDKKNPFKAVCSVGKKNKDLSMPDYFEGFIKQTEHKKEKERNILLFLENNKEVKIIPNEMYEVTLAHFQHFLYKNNIKDNLGNYYSKNSLEKHLKEEFNDEYKKLRGSLINYIINYRKVYSKSIDKFKEKLSEIFSSVFDKDFSFVKSEVNKLLIDSATNEYNHEDITIKLDTIHGVKGETHTATLFLDSSFYSKTDFKNIKNVMLENSEIKGVRMERAIKLAYVAMTRPRDLLCIAIHQDSLNEEEKNIFIGKGYKIVNV